MHSPSFNNPTIIALVARGFDDKQAERFCNEGWTIRALKSESDVALSKLGISDNQIAALRKGNRPPIPKANVIQVIWASRMTCCICREPGKAVILHHIREWSSSRDHNPENLVLLCLEHHAQAHRKGGIEQNLTPDMSRGMKVKWEEAVKSLDSRSILESGRNPAFHWWWFNHQRILEMARANGIDFRSIGSFCTAKRHADLEDNGSLGLATHSRDYLYQGGDGIYLSQFMEKILNSVLARTPVFDISNDMDRSTLKHVVQQGDLLLVRGRHFFKVLEKRSTGPGQASSVTRKVNGIEVAFIIDRWEAVSNSSFHGWLKGTQSASSLVRVVSLEENSGILQINCTGLAIGGQMPGLETRSYFKGNCPIQRYQDDSVADEDWPE